MSSIEPTALVMATNLQDLNVEQRDFVLFYADEDKEAAVLLRTKLQNLGFKGWLYNDDELLCHEVDMYQLAELAVRNSTYMLTYLTDHFFDDNGFIAHHRTEVLSRSVTESRKRNCCVPVLTKPKIEYGTMKWGFNSLTGVNCNDLYFETVMTKLLGSSEAKSKKIARKKELDLLRRNNKQQCPESEQAANCIESDGGLAHPRACICSMTTATTHIVINNISGNPNIQVGAHNFMHIHDSSEVREQVDASLNLSAEDCLQSLFSSPTDSLPPESNTVSAGNVHTRVDGKQQHYGGPQWEESLAEPFIADEPAVDSEIENTTLCKMMAVMNNSTGQASSNPTATTLHNDSSNAPGGRDSSCEDRTISEDRFGFRTDAASDSAQTTQNGSMKEDGIVEKRGDRRVFTLTPCSSSDGKDEDGADEQIVNANAGVYCLDLRASTSGKRPTATPQGADDVREVARRASDTLPDSGGSTSLLPTEVDDVSICTADGVPPTACTHVTGRKGHSAADLMGALIDTVPETGSVSCSASDSLVSFTPQSEEVNYASMSSGTMVGSSNDLAVLDTLQTDAPPDVATSDIVREQPAALAVVQIPEEIAFQARMRSRRNRYSDSVDEGTYV